jgi:hypothetical protein
LGPIILTIFNNDIYPVVKTSLILKYAGGSKLFVKVESNDDYVALQADLNHVQEWWKKWKIDINKDKCHVLQFGKENRKLTYKYGDQGLQSVEKDLGVQISCTSKQHLNVQKILNKETRRFVSCAKTSSTKITLHLLDCTKRM